MNEHSSTQSRVPITGLSERFNQPNKGSNHEPTEAAEDIFFGQSVINWARWFLIVGGAVLVLWTADEVGKLAIGIVPVMALMAMNFYLHGRKLAERPANPMLIAVASFLDLAVITVVVLLWPESEHRGLGSEFFVMYYPVVLAFAFVMRPKFTVAFTSTAMVAYALACFVTNSVANNGDLETLVARLITLGAMGGLGAFYWRIQRYRRHRATGEVPVVQDAEVGL